MKAFALTVAFLVGVCLAQQQFEDGRPKTYRRLIPADVLRGELSTTFNFFKPKFCEKKKLKMHGSRLYVFYNKQH